MPKVRRAITPWAHLSLAFDLYDRCSLPPRILGDRNGSIARIWKFERLSRRFRVGVLVILLVSSLVCLGVALMSASSERFADTLSAAMDVLSPLISIWFVAWIAAGLLSFIAGFLVAPCRLRARPFLLLHAERLRRRNLGPPPTRTPSMSFLKNRLASTSLTQELLSPLVILFILSALIVLGQVIPAAIRGTPGLMLVPLIFPVVIIFIAKASTRPTAVLSKGVHAALQSCVCPSCQYSLNGAGPPLKIKRCPECGMRYPRRMPVNFPDRPSAMSRLGMYAGKFFNSRLTLH